MRLLDMPSNTRSLTLVPSSAPPPDLPALKSPGARWLDVHCREFERRLPSLFPPTELGGLAAKLARLLGPVREVAVSPLPNKDKVCLDGPLLTVAPGYPLQLDSVRDSDEPLRLFGLYVAHEVAHIAQGISDKGRIEELHASDGEDALLWIDHEADHAAARYCEAILKTDLLALRRLQLRALRAFPAALEHRPSDQKRKARRVVDLATDIAARERGLIKPHEIAQLLWTRGGGPALVLVTGSFRRCLLRTRVGSRPAGTLEAAANKDPRGTKEKQILGIAGQIIDRGKPPTAPRSGA